MKYLLNIVFFLFFTLQATSVQAGFLKEVRGWSIFIQDETIEKKCFAAANYKNGTLFSFGVSGEHANWWVSFRHDDWKSIEQDKEYETQLLFDGKARWTLDNRGFENGLISSNLNIDIINDLAEARLLQLGFKGSEITSLNLHGTKAATLAITECHDQRIKKRDPFATNDPFESSNNDQSQIEENTSADILITSEEFKSGKILSKSICLIKKGCKQKSDQIILEILGNQEDGQIQLINYRHNKKIELLKFDIEFPAYSGLKFYILDVDKGNNSNELIISYFTGGAHCCTKHFVITNVNEKYRLVDMGYHDGDAEIDSNDMEDGVFKYIDGRFLYAFASYAESSAPLKFVQVVEGNVQNISKSIKFKAVNSKSQKEFLERCDNFKLISACASYVATSALLGKFDQAWEMVLNHYSFAENDNENGWYPSFCSTDFQGSECPEKNLIEFSNFPDSLHYALKAWSYIKLEDGALATQNDVIAFKEEVHPDKFKKFWDLVPDDGLNLIELQKIGIIENAHDCPPEFRVECFKLLNETNPKSDNYYYYGDWGDWEDAIGNDDFKMRMYVSAKMHEAKMLGFNFFKPTK